MDAERDVIYSVAMSLDGFIAGPGGEYDWIPSDDVGVDFDEFLARFDTLLMGRKTYELTVSQGPEAQIPGMKRYVFSSTLEDSEDPEVTIVPWANAIETVRRLKAEPGKQLWLFGGGQLFAGFLEAGVVDQVEVAVFPVLLGEGVPLLSLAYSPHWLEHEETREYPKGLRLSRYRVIRPDDPGTTSSSSEATTS